MYIKRVGFQILFYWPWSYTHASKTVHCTVIIILIILIYIIRKYCNDRLPFGLRLGFLYVNGTVYIIVLLCIIFIGVYIILLSAYSARCYVELSKTTIALVESSADEIEQCR